MDCNEFLARYSEYDDSRIAPTEAARFRAHMQECPSCARYDRVLRKGRMVARQMGVDSSEDFLLRLDQRLWVEAHRARASGLRRPAQIAAALAAVTVLMATSAGVGILGVRPAESDPITGGVEEVVPVVLVPEGAPVRVRAVLLPPIDHPEPRAWPAKRVDPAPSTAYSPLVVGPPAYRQAAGPSNPVYTLD
jgi:hypothetical protein